MLVFFQSIMAYNGAAIIAMRGKDCVAIASDRRFGIQAQTVGMDFQKIFDMGPHLYVGLPGLATDTQTVWVVCLDFFILYDSKRMYANSPERLTVTSYCMGLCCLYSVVMRIVNKRTLELAYTLIQGFSHCRWTEYSSSLPNVLDG